MISVSAIAAGSAAIADVFALLHKAFAYMEGRIDPPSSLNRLTLDDIAETAASGGVFGAFDGEDLVGCMFVRPDDDALYVGKLAVDPAHQGRGIGRLLMNEAEAQAARRDFSALRLQTRVELTRNHHAFAQLGFVKTAESAHDGYDRPTYITMVKVIQSTTR